MAGIVGYGAYIPLHRLGAGTSGWKAPGEKAVASFDEDSITMATAAALDCLQGRERGTVDGVYFATTTPPYEEKLSATVITSAADLRRDVFTADFGNSLRGATIALRAALDAVKAGTLGTALIVAADLRVPPPGSAFEPLFGDGAAALLVGNAGAGVEVEASYTVADELLDMWRPQGEQFVRAWEDRFAAEEGYLKVLPEAVAGLLQKGGLTAQDIGKFVLSGPTVRRVQEVAARIGCDPKTQLQDTLFGAIGNTGTPAVLIALAAALEQAKAGDRIVVANYGNGADALLLKVTKEIERAQGKSRLPAFLAAKQLMGDYQSYLRWRGLGITAAGPRRPAPLTPSASALKREEKQVLRLYGQRCNACGTVQYPEQRVCTVCHAKDDFGDVRLSDRPATLFTYGMDYLQVAAEPPAVVGVVDFEGGGRMVAAMTDRDTKKLAVGMPLEMTFRRLITVEGIHNYYWKCMPVRG